MSKGGWVSNFCSILVHSSTKNTPTHSYLLLYGGEIGLSAVGSKRESVKEGIFSVILVVGHLIEYHN